VPVIQAQTKTFTVVIDAGHGGKDKGALGRSTTEKDINLAVALKVGNLISEHYDDVKVIHTRKTDKFIELDERANIANRNKADLFISIHTNSAAKNGAQASGTETFTLGLARTDENLEVAKRENSVIMLEDNYLQRYEGFDPNSAESYIMFEFQQNRHMEQSIKFASEIQNDFKRIGRGDRSVKQAGLLVLRKTSMPAVLVELGFISNPTEERYMRSAEGQDKLAKAIYTAFTRYKKDYDKRIAATAPPKKNTTTPTEKKTTPSNDKKQQGEKTSQQEKPAVYRIQIMSATIKLKASDKRLKGYKNVGYMHENGLYKYMYSESDDLNAAQTLCRKVRKDFADAFVVPFRNNEKVVPLK
jgi:N-acetylmuramoyl-L-alanine amidase